MKIGLITIIDYKNYGNRLQNYAVQEVLKSLGCEVTTIINVPKEGVREKRSIKNTISKISKLIKHKNFKTIFRKLAIKLNNIVYKKKREQLIIDKCNSLKDFSSQFISESEFIISENSYPQDLSELYDYFIVGSDQVWNPRYRKGSSIDFLTFASKHKRIAYSPSFGVSTIPKEFEDTYKKWLNDFKSLSVREEAGSLIINKLTSKEAPVLVDPTIMLSKEKWVGISKKSVAKPKNKYLLTYILGGMSKEINNLINELSIKHDLEVVKLGDFEQADYYAIDPSEFIDYINSATIFLTDSFHGGVFSILMETQFILFNRLGTGPSMNSRIETLLTKFALTDRKWENVKKSKDYFGAKFTNTEAILKMERQKAKDYLMKSLEVEEAK